MSRKIGSAIAVVLLSVCWPYQAVSWQVIAHYQIGVEAGADLDRRYQLLPDSWPSHGSVWKAYAITKWFAWTHALQLTGRTETVPNVPRDPNDNRDPGEAMYQLYKSGTNGPNAYETALGFLTHNAQDKEVHYRFFRGGSKAAWKEEHQIKEAWADCMIYIIQMKGQFDNNGKPKNLPPVENRGHADLISHAQDRFIQSGLSTEKDEIITIEQESVAAIEKRLRDAEADSKTYLAEFDLPTCLSFDKYVLNYNWTLDELEEYYTKSVDKTKDIVKRFPR